MSYSKLMPNCCSVCLKEPNSYSPLHFKTIKFKRLQSYDTSGYLNIATHNIETIPIPLCDKCHKKNQIFKVFHVVFAILFPFILLGIMISILGPYIEKYKFLMVIIVFSFLFSFIFSIYYFKLRNAYGLNKGSFLSKFLVFKNAEYQKMYNSV